MGGGPLDSLAITAMALGVVLSAIVSLIGTSARRFAVEESRASVQDLAELTGIMDAKRLQEVFGPPDLNRIWRGLTWRDVVAARQPAGHLMSDNRVDWASIAAAGATFLSHHSLAVLALWIAVGVQAAGWIAATRLPR